MQCDGCGKKLKGGFRTDDGKFQCARCVVIQVERESTASAASQALRILNKILLPGNRPTKRQVREARSWISTLKWSAERPLMTPTLNEVKE